MFGKTWMNIQIEFEIVAEKKDKKAYSSGIITSYYVDLEFVVSRLGGVAQYDQSKNELSLSLNNKTLTCQVGKKDAYHNGEKIRIAPIVKTQDGFFGLLDSLTEYFDKHVSISADEQTIKLMPHDVDTQTYNLYGSYLYATQPIDSILQGGDSVDERDLINLFVMHMDESMDTHGGLQEWWRIYGRMSALDNIRRLYNRGHRQGCKDDIENIDKVIDADKKKLLERIKDKWGDKNILAWDLGRIVYLATACYGARYITFDEYINLSLPAIRILRDNFKDWEEYTANRADGYKYWVSGWGTDDMDARKKAISNREKADKVFLEICKETGFTFDTELNIQERDALKVEDLVNIFPYRLTLQLNMRLRPDEIRNIYEDPIDEALARYNCGIVDQGETSQTQNYEMEYRDVKIALIDNTSESMDKLKGIIEEIGVPAGSFLRAEDLELPVGRLEGLALYLNGTDLPDEVYKTCDINYVIKRIHALFDSSGHMYSYKDGHKYTAFYFYGASFDEMKGKIQAFLSEYPLCKGCKVEKIAVSKVKDLADPYPYHITLQLNARLRPEDRHYIYEDSIEEVLRIHGCGIIDGGGTLLEKNGEVRNCDVEIALVDNASENMDILKGAIEDIGVPKGSFLKSEDFELPVGRLEGLALYLNGTELPDEVYKTCDINYVIETINSLLKPGRMQSYFQGPQDTALYFYGASFDEMKGKMEAFLAEYPLCEKCRVEKIA